MGTEDLIQKNIVRALRLYFPKSLVFAVPNGGARSQATGAILKATGVLPGVSDLIFMHNKRVIFIEVKTDKGRQSPAQKEFQSIVEELGHLYWIMHSASETFERIKLLEYRGW